MPPRSHRFMSAPIRVALVGVGEIARHQHLPAIAADARFVLAATVDPAPGAAQAGVPHFATLADLLRDGPAVDAVSLCTPPRIRPALAAQAIDAGLAVMLEKPPAASLAAATDLIDRAHRAGTPLFTAWHSREAAGVAAARDWLAVRTVRAVEVQWREDVRQWHPGQDWLLAAGGFGAFDSGINALSILTAILPARLVVEACRLAIPANRAAPTCAEVEMRHGDAQVRATFDILHPGAPEWAISVTTDRGSLVLTEGGHALSIDGAPVPAPAAAEYPRLYARFAQLIDQHASEVDLAPLMLVADACLLASRETVAPFHF